MDENKTGLQLSAEDIAKAEKLLIAKAKEQLGITIKKIKMQEQFAEGENIDYITTTVLPYSREDAKRFSGEAGGELLAEISVLMADIIRDTLDVNAMVGCVAAYGSYEDIYRAKLYTAFDMSKAANNLCIKMASCPLISGMAIENGTALCEFDTLGELNEFREQGADELNASIVGFLKKADKLGFVKDGEIHVILSVR